MQEEACPLGPGPMWLFTVFVELSDTSCFCVWAQSELVQAGQRGDTFYKSNLQKPLILPGS